MQYKKIKSKVIGVMLCGTLTVSAIISTQASNTSTETPDNQDSIRLAEKAEDLAKLAEKEEYYSNLLFYEPPVEETSSTVQTQNTNQNAPAIIETMPANQNGIIPIAHPDPRYRGHKIILPPSERDLLERLVTGEAGGTYEGSLLVAQCIRDAMVCDGYTSVTAVRSALKYSGGISRKTDNAVRAVEKIFDEGANAVQHRIYYFYAPALCTSAWHETQIFILSKDGHRYFDRRTDTNRNKCLDETIPFEFNYDIAEPTTETTTSTTNTDTELRVEQLPEIKNSQSEDGGEPDATTASENDTNTDYTDSETSENSDVVLFESDSEPDDTTASENETNVDDTDSNTSKNFIFGLFENDTDNADTPSTETQSE